MEEVNPIQTAIEEIIIDNTYPAKEIAEMFERFMEWVREEVLLELDNGEWIWEVFRTEQKLSTGKELFSYWLTNVKSKQPKK